MTLLTPVPKHLVIMKEISICGSGGPLLKQHVWRGQGYGGQGSFRGPGWGESSGFDRWVSDVTADSFRGKLQGLTSLVPGMPVFSFSVLDRHSSMALLATIVRHTLDSGDTSPPRAPSTSSALCSWSAIGSLSCGSYREQCSPS